MALDYIWGVVRFYTLLKGVVTEKRLRKAGIDTHHLLVSPLNSLLSDHFLVTFEFSICGIKTENETCRYSRCLSEDAVNNFKEVILSHLPMMEYDRIAEGNDLNFTPADIDYLVNNTADLLHSALDAVAPLRKRVSYLRSSAPWYNSHIRMLKQNARKMERRWYSCKSADSHRVIGISILDQINLSLQLGYVPQVFKVAVIKPLLKKPSLDPDILANYRPISNLPFISKILEI